MGMSFLNTIHSPGSYSISGMSRPNYSPHGIRLEDLWMGGGALAGGSMPFRHIDLQGQNVASPLPLGIRQAKLKNITLFAASGGAAYLDSLMSAESENVEAFPTSADNPLSAAIWIYNSALSSFRSLNPQGALYRHNNTACGFFNKAGLAI